MDARLLTLVMCSDANLLSDVDTVSHSITLISHPFPAHTHVTKGDAAASYATSHAAALACSADTASHSITAHTTHVTTGDAASSYATPHAAAHAAARALLHQRHVKPQKASLAAAHALTHAVKKLGLGLPMEPAWAQVCVCVVKGRDT